MSGITRQTKKTFSKYQRVPEPQTAILGDNGSTVDVPGRPNYDYCRVQGQVVQVYNVRVPSRYGLKVKVGFDPIMPRLLQVLSQDLTPVSSSSSSGGSQQNGPHAETHRWLGSGPGGGQDWLPVELRQFMPLRIAPAGGLSILIYRGMLWASDAPAFHDYETVDLTSYVPATSGKALFALITIDDSNTVVVTTGSEVDTADLAISDIPTVPLGTAFVMGAVRLYEGQGEIVEARTITDIVDLRFPQYSVSGGGGSGDSGRGVHVYRSTDFTHNSSGNYLAIDFDLERRDTDGFHDPGTNPSRLTCQIAGNYIIRGNVRFAANGTGVRALAIVLNGSDFIAVMEVNNNGTSPEMINLVATYDLALTDYVELYAMQSSGTTVALNVGGYYSLEFSMTLIG